MITPILRFLPYLTYILEGRPECLVHSLLSQKLEKVRPLALQNLLIEARHPCRRIHDLGQVRVVIHRRICFDDLYLPAFKAGGREGTMKCQVSNRWW